MPLEVDFEVSKPIPVSELSLFLAYGSDVNSQHLLQCHAYLPAAMLPALMIIECDPQES